MGEVSRRRGIIAAGLILVASIVLNLLLLHRICTEEKTVLTPVPVKKKSAPAPTAPAAVPAECGLTLRRTSFQPWNDEISMRFSHGVILAKTLRMSVDPKVENLSVEVNDNDLSIHGDFQPEIVYTVTVGAGLETSEGARLKKDAAAVVRTPRLTPYIAFVTSGPYMPLDGGRTLTLSFRNVEKVRYRLSKFYENNLNLFDLESFSARERLKTVAEWEETLDFPRNRKMLKNLALDKVLPDRTPGVYLLEASDAASGSWASASRAVVLTDLAVMAVADENARQVAVAVRRISDRQPVSGAAVTLTSRKNQFAGSGTTGPDGTVRIAYADKFDNADDPVKSLIVHAGKDLAYFLLENENFTGMPPAGEGETVLPGKAPRAFLYTPRGIFRPGETVDAGLFVRRLEAGRLAVQSKTPCTLELRDPRDRVVASVPVVTDADGYASHAFKLEKTAVSGNYRLRCVLKDAVWGECAFLVGAFVPDRVKVRVKPLADGPAELAGKREFQIDARYYFGPEVTGGLWRGRFRTAPGPMPAHWRGWTVGSQEGFRPLDVKLEAKKIAGPMRFAYTGQQEKTFCPVRLTAIGEVTEPGARTVGGTCETILLPTPDFIALRRRENNAAVAEFDHTLLAFDPAAQTGSRGAWRITLERKEWQYAFNADSGRREWYEKKIPCPAFDRVLPVGPAKGVFHFAGLPEGNYCLTVTDEAGLRRTTLEFWHAAGAGTERSASPLALDISLDKPLYRAGETAELRFRTPCAGMVCAAFGAHGIDRIAQIPASAGKNVLKVRIPENVSGDAYFAGVTFAGSDGGKMLRTFGALRIPVDRSDRKLAVEIAAPAKAHPGEKTVVKVRLRDAAGRPCAGKVQLMAVDRGVLALTDFRTPDIFRFFWQSYRSGMEFYDMYDRLFPELKITPDGQIAGDGGLGGAAGLELFSHLKVVAMMLPPVAVSASGEAEIAFEVPEHQGSLQLMAVASARESAGSGEAEMIVREAAGCLAHLPRAAAPGDEFDAVFTVFNHDLAESDYKFTVKLPEGLKSAGRTQFAGRLAPGKSATFVVRVKAQPEAVGRRSVVGELEIGKFRRAWTVETVVRETRLPITETIVRAVAPGKTDRWQPDPAAWQGKPAVGVAFFGSPTAGVDQALGFLNEYPYGCLEQTVAAVFPLLAAPELVKAGLAPAAVADTVRPKAAEVYMRILPMMLADGSFAMWPGSLAPWHEATVFAAHYLAAAERAGVLKPDPAVMRRLKGRLVKYAGDADKSRNLRAYACYVLALSGGDAALVETKQLLIDGRGDLAAFFAGAALVRMGYGAEGRPAMREALQNRCYESVAFADFGDGHMTAGMTLAILMAVDPDAALASVLAEQLQRSLRPDGSAWGVTQSNAWAVMGLAKFAAVYPGAPVVAGVAEGRQPEAERGAGPFRPAEFPVAIRNRGKGMLFVRYTVRGVSARPAATGGAVKLKRTVLDASGKPVEKVRHGDLVKIRLDIEVPGPVRNLVVCDLLPGGLEIEDPRMATRTASPESREGYLRIRRLERQDDRLLLFADLNGEKASFTYTARAVTRGRFQRAPLRAEAMYDADTQGVFADPAALVVE